MICKNENIQLESEEVLDELIKIADGDLRRSINTLQTCRSFALGKKLSLSDIEKISGVVPDKVISQIYDKVRGSSGYSDIQELSQSLILDGYDVQQLIARILAFFIEA